MNPIRFFVAGVPKPQPRARSFALRGKGGRVILDKKGQPIIRAYEAGTAENWKSLIANAAREHVPFPPLQGPIRCEIEFKMPRPKAHYKSDGTLKLGAPYWHISRGDRDNLEKAVLDALTQLGMWDDDRQVCCGEVTKVYDIRAGASITIEALESQTRKLNPELPCQSDSYAPA